MMAGPICCWSTAMSTRKWTASTSAAISRSRKFFIATTGTSYSSGPGGSKSNRDGIGAKITVKAGARVLVDEVRSGSSYVSNSDVRAHFGLGSATKIEWVQVRWPSGLVERFENLPVDAIHTLKEGTGAAINPPPASAKP